MLGPVTSPLRLHSPGYVLSARAIVAPGFTATIPLLQRPPATPTIASEFLALGNKRSTDVSSGGSSVFEPNQRVKVNLSGVTIKGVAFSQNVQEALGTIVQRVAVEPPTYLIELLFSFKGVKRVEVPEDRIRRA